MSWTIDPSHTRAEFSARHMMITNVRGLFEKIGGTVDFDPQNPTQTKVDVQIEAASLNTRDDHRDGHLRSADFFDVENYPYLTFKSTRVEQVSEQAGRLYGDLTIRGVTRPVVLEVAYNGLLKNPWGKTVAGFNASAKINRKDWGLEWNVALEHGGWLVSDTVSLNIELEIVQQPEAEIEAVAV